MTSTTTTTATRTHAPAGRTATGSSLAGTPTLIRFVLRRDRIRIPVWLGALTLGTVATAASFGDLYRTAADRQVVAQTMNTPAGLAMTGPSRYLADYNFGSMMGHQMLGFTAVLVALMSVLMVVRHTRAEEETGRAELVRATVVGRHAHMTAAVTVTVATNLVLAALLAASLGGAGIEGFTWGGSLLYGAAHAAVGVALAGVAAVTAQVTEHSRGATGMAIAAIGLAYLLRAAGDVGSGALSWLSPIGWAQATHVYVDNRWWPLLPAVALAAALVAAAFVLSSRRDVGSGLRKARPGRAAASAALTRPLGMALRLHRGMLVGFAFAMALLGASYGSVLGDAEEMLGSIEMMRQAVAEIGGASMAESFASMVMMVIAVIASVYAVLAALRPRTEENDGRAEPLLVTGLSRARWLGSHLAVALLGGAGVLLLAGLGFGATGALTVGDAGLVPELLAASLAYVPALWVTVGVAVALFGLLPRATVLAWIVPLYAFVVGYLGEILQFPDWMSGLSPFGNVPQLPADEASAAPLVILTAIAAALVAVGIAAFRRRDTGG